MAQIAPKIKETLSKQNEERKSGIKKQQKVKNPRKT